MELLLVGVKGLELTEEERRLFRLLKPAGYILFSRNIETPRQVRALTDELASLNEFVPLIGIDQEGGRVVRTSALSVEAPSPAELAATGNQKLIRWHAYWTARVLRQLGFNMNFAPVLDIAPEAGAAGALRGRCWGSDVNSVVSNAGAYASTLLKGGILTCGKHFPGLGRAWVDPHYELPVVDASLDDLLRKDIIPFTALGSEWLSSVMCAHVFFPKLDKDNLSTMSNVILTDLLRNQLGYEGLVITDDLDMGAIVNAYGVSEAAAKAISAGSDLAMICHSTDAYLEAAGAINKLPEILLNDRRMRVEDFLWKKLPQREDFSEKLWEKAYNGSKEFYESNSSLGEKEGGESPVNSY